MSGTKRKDMQVSNPSIDREVYDFSVTDKNESFWRRCVYLQFNAYWVAGILSSIMLTFMFTTYELAYVSEESDEFPTLLYVVTICDILYVIDFVMALVYKLNEELKTIAVHMPRRAIFLTIDLLSLIPLDLIALTADLQEYYYTVRINRAFRLYRIFSFLVKVQNSVHYKIVRMRMLEHGIYLILLIHVFACLMEICAHECVLRFSQRLIAGTNIQLTTKFDVYILIVYMIAGRVTLRGIAHINGFVCIVVRIILLAATLTSFVLIKGFVLAHSTSALIQCKYQFLCLSNRLTVVKQFMDGSNVSPKLRHKILHYYDCLWKKRYRVMNSINLPFLPQSLMNEINLDLSWDLFKHAHFFKVLPVSFCRNLSNYVKYDSYQRGDIIFKKDEVKDKMIYICSGNVQVLVADDDDTALCSLSSGTCLGEASLIVGFINQFSVRCSSYCEVLSLESRTFAKLIQKNPMFNSYIRRRVAARIQNAKDLHALPESLDTGSINRRQKKSMMWLKSMFKVLTKKKKTDMKDEVDETSCWFDDLLYTPKYLDLIAFSEKLELVMDSVCLKTTWPWILQPNSVLTEFWDTFVLIIVILASFVIPYCAAFTISWTQSFILSGVLFELIFLADVYVQATTAIRTKEGLISEWRDILLIRLTHLGFVADCIACLPVSLISYIVAGISQQMAAKLSMNALAKLWKVESFFTKLELSFVNATAYIRLIKWTCYIYYLIYLIAVLLHVQCYNEGLSRYCWLTAALEKETIDDRLILSLYFSYMTSIGMTYSNIKVIDRNEMVTVTIIYIINAFLYICALSSVCAAKILLQGHRLRFYEVAKSLVSLAEGASLDKIMKQRLIAHLKAQWYFNEGITVLFGVSTFYDTTDVIYLQIMEETHVEILKKIQLLKGCNKDLILKLASVSQLHLIPPNEIVIHIGEVPKEMHVIVHGYCEVISILSQSMNRILGPHDTFCAVEMLLKVPLGSSVKTSTFCKILTLSYDSFIQIISSYQHEHKDFVSVIGMLHKIKEIPQHVRDFSAMPVPVTYQTEVNKSFKVFGYDMLKGSREEEDYMMPFKGHPQLKFFGYFLIRCSILPDGRFIKVWEIFRAIFAFLTVILYPVYALFPLEPLFYVLKILDATAYLDLYVRMHVAYYDKNNLLVTHPICTAGNYLKRSFLLDVIACFPFEIFVYSQGVARMSQKKEILYSYLNRVLQMYRPVLGVRYCQADIFRRYTFIRATKYLLYSFVYINWVACGLLVHTCSIGESHEVPSTNLYTEGINCGTNTWIGDSDYQKPLSPLRVYFYAFHWVTALHTVNESYGIKITSGGEAIFVMVLISIGYIYTISVYSSVVSAQQTRNIKLTTYQERMKSLVNFMKTNKIPDEMQKEAINHFELIWMRKRGREIQENFSTFHCGFKEDILYNIYGTALRKSKLFQKASKPLCDRILAESIMKLYRRRAPILHINDIHSKLYIVNKGRVDVVGPDGVRLATLGTGSMFGNIDDALRIRQSVAVAARDHTELLITDAKLFFEILEDYPNIKNKLALLTKLHMDYIPGDTTEGQVQDIKLDDYDSSTSKYSSISFVVKLRNIKNITYNPESTIIQLWEVFACTVCAYIHYVTSIYQVVFHEYSTWLLILVYLVDAFCMIRMYFRFRSGYEDEFGNIVRDSKKIAKRYLMSPLGFYFDFLTLFPFGLFCLLAPSGQRLFYLGICRLTKAPRILFMMEYFNIWNDKLNINVFFMKFGYITIFISVALHFYSCCYIALIEFMGFDDLTDLSSGIKLKIYCEAMYSCVHIFACTHFHGVIANRLSTTIFLIVMIHMSQLSTMTFIGGLCSLIEIVNHSMSKYSRSIISVKDYLKENNVYPAVLNQYWKYVCYLWETTRGTQFPILLSEAPYHLQESIKVQAYGYHIYSNYVFSQCHPDFLRQLITKLKYEVYFCGNYVAFQGDINNCMYFVHSGTVTVIQEQQDSSENVINVLKAGDVFGMMQGLHENTPHNYTFRVATVSVILTLNYHKWSYLLPFFLPSREEIYKKANRVHLNEFV